ncbi:MAG: ribosome-associated translation inhibitor RaiA [Bdellovibrionia bacterium]
MNLNISFKHIESEELIKTFIQEKSETLKRYFDGRISVAWTLSSEKQNRIAHCHLVGNEMDYFGEGSTNDLKASIGMALDKIEKQLRKHKEIVKDHLHKSRLPTT